MYMSKQTPPEPHTVITAYNHKVKLVNRTAFLADTTSLGDMRGLDNQHAVKLIVLPQPLTTRTSAGDDVHSAAAEDQRLVEKIDQINEAKLFLQLRDMDGDQHG